MKWFDVYNHGRAGGSLDSTSELLVSVVGDGEVLQHQSVFFHLLLLQNPFLLNMLHI